MSVRERTREIAILRTLGYSPMEILQTVIGESVLISVVGGAVAIAFTLGLTTLGSSALGPFGDMIKFTPQVVLAVGATATLIGVFAAIVPAVLASRRNIVESLRYTG